MLSSAGKYINQVDSRILRCRKSYFSFNNVGMPYPGLPVDLKLHFWHTICRPILIYGLETVYLNRAMYIKHELSSKLMAVLGILPIEENIKSRSMFVSLMKRLFLVNYPVGLRSLYV